MCGRHSDLPAEYKGLLHFIEIRLGYPLGISVSFQP
jgi:hypothetical protein